MKLPEVWNPYIHAKTYFIETDAGLMDVVYALEERTGLNFVAEVELEVLHGFVTKFPEGIIVALYKENKMPDADSPHTFQAVEITEDLENRIYGKV